MGNANTEHSRALRLQAAKKTLKNQTAANRFEIRNRNAAKIAAIKDGLKDIPGCDNTETLLLLLSTYNKIAK